MPTPNVEACSNILVGRKASVDGSAMISYSADSYGLYGEMYFRPAALYAAGTMLDVYEWDTGKFLGQIPQVESTYSVMGNMNEHQLIITETTFGGRRELGDKSAIMDYGSLIYITLQRAKTAREAIDTIVSLANEYGYYSSGESFSIADKEEVWMMELIGKGEKIENGKNVNKGIVWVAQRIPDDCIAAHANQARISTFDLNDPENSLYSPDVITFAREMGYFDGKDKDFSFCDAYNPLDFTGMRICEARAWSIFNQLGAEDMSKYLDYAMGDNPKNRFPLYMKAKKGLSVKDVADAMRDHYEDTPMDPRNNIGAGGQGMPYRWKPLIYKFEDKEYFSERPIATQQSGFWLVAQARAQYDDIVGGIIWFGVDDAATSPLTPIYSSATAVSEWLQEGNGSMMEYSPTSAFWLVNRMANFAYLRYSTIATDIKKEIDKHEYCAMAAVAKADSIANVMMQVSPEMAREFLTHFSVTTADKLYAHWDKLDKYLLVKHIDGNSKKVDEGGNFIPNKHTPLMPASQDATGYDDIWKRAVIQETGDALLVK